MSADKRQLQVLKEARRLIAAGWCQRDLARDENGAVTDVFGEDARKFCALGAVLKARDAIGGKCVLSMMADPIRKMLPASDRFLKKWNDRDGRTQEEVLEAFDKAIAWLMPG